jgi:hypothetical protein
MDRKHQNAQYEGRWARREGGLTSLRHLWLPHL